MKKIQSTAIYYALFLSVIFALLLGGLILYSSFNQNFALQMTVEETLIDNANSGIAYGQTHYRELPADTPLELRLFGEGIDSVSISTRIWGAYTILQSSAKHKNKSFTKVALFGASNQKKQPTLYLPDNGRPISLCGETRIEGECFLPKSGLKRAYIEGKNYQGDRLIYGISNPSAKQLPALNPSFLTFDKLTNASFEIWDNELDSIIVSFQRQPIHFLADGVMDLDQMVIKGQVYLESRDSVFIRATSEIENAIVKGRIVRIEEGFTGTVQIFATEKIILENNVLLKYPSVLAVYETEFPTETNVKIEVGENTQVIGTILLTSSKPNFRLTPMLSIAKGAEIDGLIYCAGKTEIRGTIKGSLFTQTLFLKTASSAYENHLLDAQLLDQLPSSFIAANLFESTTTLKRIAWLN